MSKRRINYRQLIYFVGLLASILLMSYLYQWRKSVSEARNTARNWQIVRSSGALRLATTLRQSEDQALSDTTLAALYQLIKQIEASSGLQVDLVMEQTSEQDHNILLEGRADMMLSTLPSSEQALSTITLAPNQHLLISPLLPGLRDSLLKWLSPIPLGNKVHELRSTSPPTDTMQPVR